MATAGSIVVDLLMRTGSFETDTARAEKRLKQLQRQIDDTAKKIGTAFGAGVAVAVGALATLTIQSVNYADQLDELSNRLGISTEQLSAWGYAAKLTGSDLDSLASTIPRLSKNLAGALDEGSRQADLFKALGVEVTDAAGRLRDVEDVLPEIADRFKELRNDTAEAALAQELFGKSGAEFLEFLNLGSDGLATMAGEAERLGAVVDGQTAAAAAEFKDELDRLSTAATGLGTEIAAQMLPVLVELTGTMREWVEQGDLARNTTTLLTAAVNAGVGTIDAYNNAIDRTAIAIGVAVEAAKGYLQIQAQLATLGFAEGSASDGWKQITNAFTSGQRELDDLIARQNAPRSRSSVPGVDEMDFNLGAPTAPGEGGALDSRVNRYLRDADGKSKSAKATKELTEAEKAWQAVMEVNALIDDQVQDYRSQQIEDAYALEKAREAAAQRVDDQISDMEFEYELLGKTNRERAQEIELRYAGAEATEEQRKKIAELAGAMHDESQALDKQVGAMDALRDVSVDFLGDIREGVSIFDALGNAVDKFASKIGELLAEGLVDQLFGQRGDAGGGAAGGWFGSLLGLVFGGGRAGGGDVLDDRAYLVGERGPELFVPRTSGTVVTSDRTSSLLGGARGDVRLNQTFVVQGAPDRRTREQMARTAGTEAQRGIARTGRGR